MDFIEKQLKHWKDKLIDLSKKNRLLNFRPTKVTTIRIVDEIPSEIYKIIVLKATTMEFLPLEIDKEKQRTLFTEEKEMSKIDTSSREFEAYESSQLENKYLDKYLQTDLTEKTLERNLLRIYSKASSVMEEQGYNTLFLALGFLEWYESDNSDIKLQAPLILVPVELIRKSVRGKFKLKYTEEPPLFNPALLQKLKVDFGIDLNMEEYLSEDINPQRIFLNVKEAVKDYKRWRVTNDIYLTLFSFAKFIMYKDIEKHMELLSKHPIIRRICGESTDEKETLDLLEEKKLDEVLSPFNTFQILDADSSQQRAILAAKRGKNIIIEGPPGTGKSQTIANIIAEFLAEGKKVLFVSQKMAALEVVKKRLEICGLGDFCLELHSKKVNKKEVLKELEKVMELEKLPDHSNEEEMSRLEQLKDELNNYVKDLHTPYGKLGITPYQAFSFLIQHQEIPDIFFNFENVSDWDKQKYDKCCKCLEELVNKLSKIQPYKSHPWYGSKLTAVYYQDKLNLMKLMDQILDIFHKILSCINKLAQYPFFNKPSSIAEIKDLININFLLCRKYRYLKNPFLFFTPSFWKDRTLLKKYLSNEKYKNILERAINKIKEIKHEKINFQEYKFLTQNLSAELNEFQNKIETFFNYIKFDPFLVFGTHYKEYPLVRIVERIKVMRNNIDSLNDWAKYQNAFKNCKEMGLENFVEKVLAFNLPLEKIVNTFKCQFLKCWLGKVFSERESLNKFCGEDHEKLIQEFQLLDKKQIELAKIRIRHRLSGKVDKRYVPSRNSELGILLREFKKTKAHLPIRKLFEKAPNLILELKPCLMMSPLTVAQFLNPELIKFDLVIFDEASQIPPEESIGAILRGKQVVIAGDTKQLPPTTFFQSEVLTPEDEDSPEVEELSDLDSILDVCELSSIPKVMLRWHYRSKHEHLIAFSNKEFYNNRLFTFPSAEENNPKLGIRFHYIPNAIYDRGGKGTNIKEAIEVAKAVFKHFKETPELSLGVGTFSIRQKFLIEEIIEKMLKEDNSLEPFFSRNRPEHFFVKNLETIQGDERDVIFISVGYGKDHSGKLSMNFGPLNKIGGERRLNVLITRARMRVEIFSSIRGDDIDLSKTDSEGVRLLKKYLDFAEKGPSILMDNEANEEVSESPFEEAVYNLLVKKGVKVKKQVGCSGYRIDLAVIDDKNPGRYILGIECDGATYHSSATARDRDRLRQQVLESLGWNIYRIWSTDWFKNPRKEFEKLLKVIEEAKKGNFSKFLKKN